MLTLLQASIFQTGGAPSDFKVKDQRLYVVFGRETTRTAVHSQKLFIVFGRETTRLSVREQRLYVIIDNSAETDFRYWRMQPHGNPTGFWLIREMEFMDTEGGSDVTTSASTVIGGSDTPISGITDRAHAFDDDTGTYARIPTTTTANNGKNWIGIDFGSGNEIQLVEMTMTRDGTNRYPEQFELQGSNDLVSWSTVFYFDEDTAIWPGYQDPIPSGGTRVFNRNIVDGIFDFRVDSADASGGALANGDTEGTMFNIGQDFDIEAVRFYPDTSSLSGNIVIFQLNVSTQEVDAVLARQAFGSTTAGVWEEVTLSSAVSVLKNQLIMIGIERTDTDADDSGIDDIAATELATDHPWVSSIVGGWGNDGVGLTVGATNDNPHSTNVPMVDFKGQLT